VCTSSSGLKCIFNFVCFSHCINICNNRDSKIRQMSISLVMWVAYNRVLKLSPGTCIISRFQCVYKIHGQLNFRSLVHWDSEALERVYTFSLTFPAKRKPTRVRSEDSVGLPLRIKSCFSHCHLRIGEFLDGVPFHLYRLHECLSYCLHLHQK
jgi:hypothetical protein